MSIKVSVTSPDLEKQLHRLEQFPEFVKKHFRPAMKGSVSLVAGYVGPRIPRKTGKAAGAFGSKVTGTGLSLTGRVGWYDPGDPWYINVVEHGARPHPLNKGASVRSKKRWALFNRYVSDPNRIVSGGTHVNIGGRWVTIEIHPGFSARGFMAAGYSAAKPGIESRMEQANDAVLMELKT